MNTISQFHALYSVPMAPQHVVLAVATALLFFRLSSSVYSWLSKTKEAVLLLLWGGGAMLLPLVAGGLFWSAQNIYM